MLFQKPRNSFKIDRYIGLGHCSTLVAKFRSKDSDNSKRVQDGRKEMVQRMITKIWRLLDSYLLLMQIKFTTFHYGGVSEREKQ